MYIETWSRIGTRHLKSKLLWPDQCLPTSSDFRSWRKCLRLAFNPNGYSQLCLQENLPLRRYLGHFTRPSHVIYDWYWDEIYLYSLQTDNTYLRHNSTNPIIRDFACAGTTSTLPPRSTTVSTYTHNDKIHVQSHHLIMLCPRTIKSTFEYVHDYM